MPPGRPLVLAVGLVTLACGVNSRGTRVGNVVSLPRSIHCSLEIIQHDEPVLGQHDVIGTVEVWGVGNDRAALEREIQLRACELGADAVIKLQLRNTEADQTWVGQAVVWKDYAENDEPVPAPRAPAAETVAPVNAEVAPVSAIEEGAPPPKEEVAEEPRSKRKRKGKGKRKGKRRRRR